MSTLVHRIYIYTLVGIVVLTTIFLAYEGFSYYFTSLEERFYHPDHAYFKPSGLSRDVQDGSDMNHVRAILRSLKKGLSEKNMGLYVISEKL